MHRMGSQKARPPMHALYALSQDAPAGRRVRRGDVLQKEDASPRRKETRPHEVKKSAYNAGRKGRGRRPATTPEHHRGGCIRGGGTVGARGAPGGHPRPRSPPGSQSAYNAG